VKSINPASPFFKVDLFPVTLITGPGFGGGGVIYASDPPTIKTINNKIETT
jgi:hypothetical protein